MFGMGDDQAPLFSAPLPPRYNPPVTVDPPHFAKPAPAGMSTDVKIALGLAAVGVVYLLLVRKV